MSTFKIFKETALPGTLQPNSIYLVTPSGEPTLVELYVTGTDAATVRHVISKSEVETLISDALSSVNELQIVANIAARNALTPNKAIYVYVEDATGDPTVNSGGATYLYKIANTSWIKVSESESLDVVINWAAITGKPTSSPAQIDAAVAAVHNHANKTQLDLIGQNGAGELTYNGTQVKTEWSNAGW